MNSVLVVGSIAYDSIETASGKKDHCLGGAATYFSTAASLFVPVRVVAVVGEDFKENELDFLQKRNVDFSGLQKHPGQTFRWGCRYSQDFLQRETLFTHLNVFENFNPMIPELFRSTPFVFLANINPDLQISVLSQIQNPKFVALDTMNYWINQSLTDLLNVLKMVNGLIINDEEARMLSGEMSLIKAMQKIRSMGPDVLIVKKGENGAILMNENELFFLPAYPVQNLMDPTGAGDTFAGGFMGYLTSVNAMNINVMRNALVFGSAVASLSVEDFGLEKLKNITQQNVIERCRYLQKVTQFTID